MNALYIAPITLEGEKILERLVSARFFMNQFFSRSSPGEQVGKMREKV